MRQEDASIKSLIFSNWPSLFEILGPLLKSHNLLFTKLTGSMTPKQREHVINKFTRTQDVNLLLVSKYFGALGLNLTEANHVHFIDPWWNPVIEDQCIDRVHRKMPLKKEYSKFNKKKE